MPITGALISGGIGLAGSLYGSSQARKQADAAASESQKIIDEVVRSLEALDIPSVEALEIALNKPKLVGELVPHMQSVLPKLESAASEIKSNPKLEEAQFDALDSLQERAQGGLTAKDRADIAAVRRESSAGLAGQDANIIQNMEQRGIGGSGAELAMRLNAKSKAQSQASEESDRLAAMNYQAKMNALQGAGNMAGNMQTADFNRQFQKAQSQDAIGKFNQANAYNVNQSNVNALNRADEKNLSAAQQIANTGTALSNQEQMHNKKLIADDYDRRLAKTTAVNNAKMGKASNINQRGATQAQNTSDMYGNITNAVTTGVGIYSQS